MVPVTDGQSQGESKTYFALSAEHFTIEDGMLDNCVEMAFLDDEGRLMVIPCSYVQRAQRLFMYQFDGFRSYRQNVDIVPDGGQWSITYCGRTSDNRMLGYIVEDSDFNRPVSQFFTYDIGGNIWETFETPTVEGEKVNIRAAVQYQDDIFVLSQTPDKAHVYKLVDGALQHEMSLNTPGAGGALRASLAFYVDDETFWFESWHRLLYRVDRQTREVRSVVTENHLDDRSYLENRLMALPSGELLYALNGSLSLYKVDKSTLEITPYRADFGDSPARPGDEYRATVDDAGNLLIVRQRDGVMDGRLLDPTGDISNFTPVVRNLPNDNEQQFSRFRFTGRDFRDKILSAGLDFTSIEVTSRPGIQAYRTGATRELIELPDGALLLKGKRVLRNGEIENTSDFFANCISGPDPDGDILIMSDNEFWFQAVNNQGIGILNLDDNTCRNVLPGSETRRMCHGPDGSVLVVADRKLIQLDPSTGATLQRVKEQIEAFVNQIHYASNGAIYLATSEGLFIVDNASRSLQRIPLIATREVEQVLSIYEDGTGQLWIGTHSDGLHIHDPESGSVSTINTKNGLSNNIVATIINDGIGRIWCGTFNGITIFNQDQSLVGYVYEEAGLVDNECNRWSAQQLRNGQLMFGTPYGFSIINPDFVVDAIQTLEAPKIYLTQLTGGELDITVGEPEFAELASKRIDIPASNRSLAVSYGLSNYASPTARSYAYKLDLPNQDWNYVGGIRDLNLSGLPSGRYDVLIKGFDHRGTESSNQLTIALHVEQFFYKTWWFYCLLALPFLAFGVLWIRRQTAEQKRLETEVERRTETIKQQADELRQLDKMKSRLYTNITHEFRTPLTVIRGLADKVNEDQKAPELIKRNSENLLNLVNQMLDLRKLESGNLKFRPIQADIARHLSYIGESLRSLAEEREHTFHFLSNQEALVVDFDPEKITRIVTNLISNAIKFTPPGGDIYLQLQASEQSYSLQVTDTGIGIAPDKLKKVFDRFYQVDDSETRRGEGTGIGLTLVRELVGLMGGSIEAKSRVGHGTTFEVTLPISNDAPLQTFNPETTLVTIAGRAGSPPDADIREQLNGHDAHILIVEDNPDVVHYIGTCLSGHYNLSIALDGEEGINKAIELVPDLIVSDVMMPKQSGFDLLSTLKSDERTSHIPIILLTAKADVESRLTGLKRGAEAYLAKPFDEEELRVRVAKLIESRQLLQKRYASGASFPVSHEPATELEDAFITRFKDILLANLNDEHFGVGEMQHAMGISRTQLYNKIAALTGKSTSQYMRTIRLAEALKLFAEKDMNVSEIAYAVGFKDPRYFTRVFKEEFGVTPSEYAGTL